MSFQDAPMFKGLINQACSLGIFFFCWSFDGFGRSLTTFLRMSDPNLRPTADAIHISLSNLQKDHENTIESQMRKSWGPKSGITWNRFKELLSDHLKLKSSDPIENLKWILCEGFF